MYSAIAINWWSIGIRRQCLKADDWIELTGLALRWQWNTPHVSHFSIMCDTQFWLVWRICLERSTTELTFSNIHIPWKWNEMLNIDWDHFVSHENVVQFCIFIALLIIWLDFPWKRMSSNRNQLHGRKRRNNWNCWCSFNMGNTLHWIFFCCSCGWQCFALSLCDGLTASFDIVIQLVYINWKQIIILCENLMKMAHLRSLVVLSFSLNWIFVLVPFQPFVLFA